MVAQFTRDIDYTTWLSNVVMVKKPGSGGCAYTTLV